MSARSWFLLGLGIALIPTLTQGYLLWPFPGSQDLESVRWAYALSRLVPLAQGVGALLAVSGLILVWRSQKRKAFWVLTAIGLLAIGLCGATRKFAAPAIFRPNLEPRFARGSSTELPPQTLVLGLRSGEVAKAYPLRLIAYHHQVQDVFAGEPIWVTYCSMCRTGKIFRPVVQGQSTSFDLIGAIRYNSVYRDQATGSFWYQANGKAVAGPLTGTTLTELRSDQMTLGKWLELFPDSEVLQPDPAFAEGYQLFGFAEFDEKRSDPEGPLGWQWVVGVRQGDLVRGYPWSMLADDRYYEDELGELPLAIHLLADGFSHRVWDRHLNGRVLHLRRDPASDRLLDDVSGSWFGFDGVAQEGELAGSRLQPVPSTVEYRHSFEYFAEAEIVTPPTSPGESEDAK